MMATIATRQDSTFHTHVLPNGLQMIGQTIPGVESVAAIFWVCTGTRDEVKDQMGVSHFLEHMAFRGTPHLSSGEVDRAWEEMGADHNAATSWEMTFYWARVLSENTDRAIEVLSELTRPVLDAEAFDQERNVILEEIARYEDQPVHVLFNQFMSDFFGEYPLAWETLGTPQTIRALTVEEMRDYWRRRYGASNIIFSIAGGFDWEHVKETVGRLTAHWEPGQGGRALGRPVFEPKRRVHRHDRFVQQHIAIGTPLVARSDPRYYAAALLATILGDETGSRLFWSVYQEGLADSASAQAMEFEDTGMLLVHIGTDPRTARQALAVTQGEMERLQRFDVDRAELERAKAKLNSSVIIGGESTNERVMGLISSWLTQGRLETLEEVRQKIDAVTLGDLKSLLNDRPVWPNQVVTAVGPLSQEELFSPRPT
jgi:predicted Zn-dependent peptidase